MSLTKFSLVIAVLGLCSMEPLMAGGVPPIGEREIVISTEPGGTQRALVVRVMAPVSVSGPMAGRFVISVANSLGEGVFLVVEGFDELGFSYRKESSSSSLSGFSGGVLYPLDTSFLLRRLSSAWISDGRSIGTEACYTLIDCRLMRPEGIDFRDMLGADVRAFVTISGYFQRDGKSFSAQVELPIVFSDAETEPERQPNFEGCVRPERDGVVNTTHIEHAPGGPETKSQPTKD